MIIQTKPLIAALNNIKPVVSRRITLSILACVKLHTERNRLHITATNLDEFIVERVEVEGEIEPVCVSFNYLLMALSGETTAIKLQKGSLKISCGENETEIATIDAADFAPLPEMKKSENHGVACNELGNAVNLVSWASLEDESRYVLKSVYVSSSEKKLSAVATNGRELAIAESAIIGSDFDLLAPSEFIGNFSFALSRTGATLSTTDNQIKVSHEWGNYFCKKVEGNYPNYSQVIPKGQKPLGTVSVDEFRAVVQSCVGFSQNSEAKGLFKFSKNELEIEFLGDNNAKLSRHMAGSFAAFGISLSTKKMLKILSNIKTDEAKLFFTDELSPISIESGELKVFTMPMRV